MNRPTASLSWPAQRLWPRVPRGARARSLGPARRRTRGHGRYVGAGCGHLGVPAAVAAKPSSPTPSRPPAERRPGGATRPPTSSSRRPSRGWAWAGPASGSSTSDGKSLTVAEFSGLGTIGEGTNGKVFWAAGSRPRLSFSRRRGGRGSARRCGLEPRPRRRKSCSRSSRAPRTIGADGKPLECVIATHASRSADAQLLRPRDAPSSRRRRESSATPDGDVPFRDVPRDWRDVGGIKIPFESETQVGPVTQVVRLRSVTFDEPMDAKMFEPPAPKASRP